MRQRGMERQDIEFIFVINGLLYYFYESISCRPNLHPYTNLLSQNANDKSVEYLPPPCGTAFAVLLPSVGQARLAESRNRKKERRKEFAER